MSDIIPSCPWADFVRIVEAGKINEMKACEVIFNGDHPFTAIIFHGDRYGSDNIRINAEFLANRSNIIGGLDPEEVLASLLPEPILEQSLYDKRVAAMAHAREAKQARKVMVNV